MKTVFGPAGNSLSFSQMGYKHSLQVPEYLEKMGLDAFDHYVSKLADFIIKNGATVKSHYDTILRWWREDSIV